MSILANKIAAKAPPKADSLLAKARASCPRGEFVTLPVLGRVWIELAAEQVVDEIEGTVMRDMAELGLPPTVLNAMTYDSRRLALTLAWAVRNPDDIAEHAGTQAEWIMLDIELISACGVVYGDVRHRLNPIDAGMTPELFEEIRLACEKKSPRLLRTYGVALLSNYLATTGGQPASSPEPPSSAGPS